MLHPNGAFNHVTDVVVGVGAELTPVRLGEELGEAAHHAERLLQVMGGDVGELLELGIGAR